MANTHSTLGSLFADIANAIRAKTGTTETIKADNFPSKINEISTGKKVFDLGSGQSFNVKQLLESQGITKPDSFYKSLTADNFVISGFSSAGVPVSYSNCSISFEKSYNSSNMVASIRVNYAWNRYNYQTERTEYFNSYLNVHAHLIV